VMRELDSVLEAILQTLENRPKEEP
jgi:hypothetical protein